MKEGRNYKVGYVTSTVEDYFLTHKGGKAYGTFQKNNCNDVDFDDEYGKHMWGCAFLRQSGHRESYDYFMDATVEGWIANDTAVMELVDNTNGHTRYTMTTKDNKLWSAQVPATASNITFNRYNKEKTVVWNSWSAGGRSGKVTYKAEGTSNGRWTDDVFDQEGYKEGDIVYLDLADYTDWSKDGAVLYVNFTNATKSENGGNNVTISTADQSLYHPVKGLEEVKNNLYSYQITAQDAGASTLRFWRGNETTLWNCSVELKYEDYKTENNCVKVTGWSSSGSIYKYTKTGYEIGDIIYLDVSSYPGWLNDSALLYVNFTAATKDQNNGQNVTIADANKALYNPAKVTEEAETYVYKYTVTEQDAGASTLRFWRGNASTLWNCSVELKYEDYKTGHNGVKVTGWTNSGNTDTYRYEDEKTGYQVGDKIYLDVSQFPDWLNNDAIFYVNFTAATKEQNNGQTVDIASADKSIYNPIRVTAEAGTHRYQYVITEQDTGATTLRFWRGNTSTLWHSSKELSYEAYKDGTHSVIITDWSDPLDEEEEEEGGLPDEDIPEIMNKAEMLEKGHIERLREQETDLNSAIFLNQDDTKTMYVFGQPIKYTDEEGEIQDKSNQLTDEISDTRYAQGYAYVNANNDVHTYFPNELEEDTCVVLTNQDTAIEIYPVTDKTASVNKVDIGSEEGNPRDAVEYHDIFGEDTTMRYASEFGGLKEDIILDKNMDVNEFSYVLKTGGLRLVEQDGEYFLQNPETEEEVFALGNLYIYDSKEREEMEEDEESDITYTHAYRMETIEEDEEYLVTIVVDEAYLNSPDTVYPVTIDPSITTIEIKKSGIQDATLLTNCSKKLGSSGSLHVGNYKKAYPSSSYQTARALVRFPGLFQNATINKMQADEIVSVQYIPRDLMCYDTTTTTINCYRVTKPWQESKVSYNQEIWGAYDTKRLDTEAVRYNNGTQAGGIRNGNVSNNHYYPFDITEAVKDWMNGSYGGKDNHYGIMLKASDEDKKAITFGSRNNSSYPPCVVLTWNEPTSLALSPNGQTIDINSTLQLKAKVSPNGAPQRVIWKSKDTKIATVDENGLVTGKGSGTVEIIATSAVKSSISANVMITVVRPTNVKVSPVNTIIGIDTIKNLTVTVEPSNLKNKGVTWSSSDTTVATVNKSGQITGKEAGTATITAVSELDSKIKGDLYRYSQRFFYFSNTRLYNPDSRF